jgi:hypothetical protein
MTAYTGHRQPIADDAVYMLTRAVANAVIPFLLVAFAILYLPGDRSLTWFAWPIRPPLTAAVMGAGYLGGAYFFARVASGTRWHQVAGGFLPVTAFTLAMLLATLLHWDVFDPGHWPFWVWLTLYAITPLVVPWVWWRNRTADPGTPDLRDFLLPSAVRPIMIGFGTALCTAVVIGFIWPGRVIALWPWELTPLTARVMAGWGTLPAVGALTLAQERRWSGWRVSWQSILIWQTLIVVAFGIYGADMGGGLLNWYVVFTVGGVLAAAAIAIWAEVKARKGGAG